MAKQFVDHNVGISGFFSQVGNALFGTAPSTADARESVVTQNVNYSVASLDIDDQQSQLLGALLRESQGTMAAVENQHQTLLHACRLPNQPVEASFTCALQRSRTEVGGTLYIFRQHLVFASHDFAFYNDQHGQNLLAISIDRIAHACLANSTSIGFVTTKICDGHNRHLHHQFNFTETQGRERAYEKVRSLCFEHHGHRLEIHETRTAAAAVARP